MQEETAGGERKKILGEMLRCQDCGNPMIRRSYNQVVCPDCGHTRMLLRSRERTRMETQKRHELEATTPRHHNYPRNRKSGKRLHAKNHKTLWGAEETVPAKCPMCGKHHPVPKTWEPFPGAVPRIYCEPCRVRVAEYDSGLNPHSVGYY